ncbi:MAG: geranylgeranyl reductase family protein [Firmicutes bacterium]|nr:geranylgeranyl reductase family protein [Bacillota bacterium]
MPQVDVVVIGAGPAGATCARLLAQAGLSVLVLEKAPLPRVKPCGGALTHRALALLPDEIAQGIASHPRRWTLLSREETAVTVSCSTPYCHVVDRPTFDLALVRAAIRLGAVVHDDEALLTAEPLRTGWILRTPRGHYSAGFVIAADGAHSVMARLVQLPRAQRGAALEAEFVADADLWSRYLDRVEIRLGHVPWGYGWVIPRDGLLNVGVGSFRPASFPLKQQFFALVADIGGPRTLRPLGHPLPYRWAFVPPMKANVLFVGDAAGYMDAFSAEGIYSALLTATVASDSLIRHLTHGEPLSNYAVRLFREMWPELRAAVRMSLLFYPWSPFWARYFAKNPRLIQEYLGIARGDGSYRTLQRHAAHTLFHHRLRT